MFFAGAFSTETRMQIRERADNKSELSGKDNRPLQCSHFNHKKKSKHYDKEEMGILVTDIEHLAYHLRYRKKPKKIGLPKISNERAIRDVWLGILSQNMMELEELYDEVFEAFDSWDNYFEERRELAGNIRSNREIQPITREQICDIMG